MEMSQLIRYPEDYKPEKQDIIKKYATVSQIFAHPMSPTIVTLVKNLSENTVFFLIFYNMKVLVSKSVQKKKLVSPEQIESAKRECVIQSALNHPNLVKMYEYTETEDDFRIFMEYMNMPDYLSEKIEDVFF